MKSHDTMLALFLIFLVLKLTDLITWSWWWVTCPLWFAPAAATLVVLSLAIIAYVTVLLERWGFKK